MTDYTPDDYDAMFADTVRREAYFAAIAKVIRSDDVVVEIGTGVGYFAVAACRAGARKVYAIEIDRSILLAEQVVAENGCADRIVCIPGNSNAIALPERGTVLISDLRGVLPMRADAITTIMHARRHLLTPDARLIPARDTIRAAPCTAPERWAEVELALGPAPFGISRTSVTRHARSVLHRIRIGADTLCSEPGLVATLDYSTIENSDFDGSFSALIERRGRVEGLALWFDAQLAEGAGFSTSPAAPKTMYGQAFLPFERALDAEVGDVVQCRLLFKLVRDHYVAIWDTVFRPAGSARPSVEMRQSTLGGLLRSPADLARRRSDFTPDPAETMQVRELLSLVDGKRTVADIAAELLARHPDRFAGHEAALAWVSERHEAVSGLAGS